ncbi:MAG: isocitrate/isopropylmalate dehydrogenase family protein [Nitrososphaerota archaeon]|jgi:3-isopropylmalate dehydrogenase|nr:isocitrate/isopropylmalate dehydrogenase family protein [Nitrososphaerota archaeon]MDG6927411.1 isocitrate/isopropylmalate dehydrogenase family protein [Nitrososphaerota archaeon]MDG6931215.1 isocitrate/isopropylmalate dehydrogenase family protein [Nitrososphaerota archaeon]MDG6931878.1 isocitrate/isopropylmalate dehydrogenase family protein [Nitrososphaerota archaeon]MDG6936602.1 isocitrate/isopropylmalate dehydrogenase family protein [Nitrososphaerota archaeon]
MRYRVAWMKGDGIGPEISDAAIEVLNSIQESLPISFDIKFYDLGDRSKIERGSALPEETVEGIKSSDASIKGPVGESAFESIVAIRQKLDLYANIRPARSYEGVPHAGKIDAIIVRENTEDLYKGIEFEVQGVATSLRIISEKATRRIAKVAATYAIKRRKHVTVVHKANVLRVSDGLFRRVALEELGSGGLTVDEKYVDAMSMALIRNPEQFDIILTPNVYGDILSDEASQIAGGLGFAASANIGDLSSLFEPVHGSAPDIAGKGVANPYSMVMSLSMMLNHIGISRSDNEAMRASAAISSVVEKSIKGGILTPDAGGRLTTKEVGRELAKGVKEFVQTG